MTQNSDIDEVQALYQRIMAELEPDLLLENIAGIPQKYAAETEEQRAVRKTRYAAAFAECFRRIDAVIHQMKNDSHAFKAHVLELCRTKENESAVGVLQSLEDSIGNS